jgi:DsbC/DsbD-like thiol-disulfide interchange protein
MISENLPCRRLVSIVACVVALAASDSPFAQARAQESSPWVSDKYSSLRLLSGLPQGKTQLAGIEITMKPGWKTYWRTPGDSGIPPRFDFSKSDNVETVTVLWPAPQRFPDGAGGHSIGYSEVIVLPLMVTRKDANAPAILRANVDYAVCEKLCVPVRADTELNLSRTSPLINGKLAVAVTSVPKLAKLGEGDLTIQAVRREGEKKVVVETKAPQGETVDLFVEGPTHHWALPLPVATETPASGSRRFAFNLEGLPADAKASGAALKFTLVSPVRAYEYNVTLP